MNIGSSCCPSIELGAVYFRHQHPSIVNTAAHELTLLLSYAPTTLQGPQWTPTGMRYAYSLIEHTENTENTENTEHIKSSNRRIVDRRITLDL
jgi:hypothetical protein